MIAILAVLSSQSMKISPSIHIANLYRDNYAWLYHWLRKNLGSQERAEDVLQDTFVKIIKSKDIFNVQHPESYIYSTAKRIIIDQARRQKIEQAYRRYIAQCENEACYPSPEHMILVIEMLDQMAVVLDTLEVRVRQILMMHYIDNIKQRDIAHIMNISIKTVQRDLIKGLLHCHKSQIL